MYVINVKTGIYYLCPWTFAFPFWWCCRRKPGPCAHQANALVTYPLAPQIEAFCGHCSTALRSMTYMFLSTLPQSMSGAEQPLSLHHCFRGVQPAAGDANCSVKRLPLGCPASRRSRRLSSVSPANWNDWQGQSVKSCLCLLGLFGCIQTHFFFCNSVKCKQLCGSFCVKVDHLYVWPKLYEFSSLLYECAHVRNSCDKRHTSFVY